jgi:hypothetical protein
LDKSKSLENKSTLENSDGKSEYSVDSELQISNKRKGTPAIVLDTMKSSAYRFRPRNIPEISAVVDMSALGEESSSTRNRSLRDRFERAANIRAKVALVSEAVEKQCDRDESHGDYVIDIHDTSLPHVGLTEMVSDTVYEKRVINTSSSGSIIKPSRQAARPHFIPQSVTRSLIDMSALGDSKVAMRVSGRSLKDRFSRAADLRAKALSLSVNSLDEEESYTVNFSSY